MRGTALDDDLLAAYRLLWAATDLAAYTVQLHEQHSGHVDDQRALRALQQLLTGNEPRPIAIG